MLSEEFSLEDRVVVAGVPVSIKLSSCSIEIVIEGNMDEGMAASLVQDIKEGVEAHTGLSLVLKNH